MNELRGLLIFGGAAVGFVWYWLVTFFISVHILPHGMSFSWLDGYLQAIFLQPYGAQRWVVNWLFGVLVVLFWIRRQNRRASDKGAS